MDAASRAALLGLRPARRSAATTSAASSAGASPVQLAAADHEDDLTTDRSGIRPGRQIAECPRPHLLMHLRELS